MMPQLLELINELRFIFLLVTIGLFNSLAEILTHVGKLVRLDHFITSKQKVKFAKPCVNISVNDPIPGSLYLSLPKDQSN